MKILLILAAVGAAFGTPIMEERIFYSEFYDLPITDVPYEKLVPVVREAMNTILRSTIPMDCTRATIPYLAIGLVRSHCVNVLRDVLVLLESSTVEDALLLDTIRNPIHIPTTELTIRANEILYRMKERIPLYNELPIPRINVHTVTPAQVKLLEIYDVIHGFYEKHVTELMSIMHIAEPMPFEKLLVTKAIDTLSLGKFSMIPTLRELLPIVTKEMVKLVELDPRICEMTPISPEKIIMALRGFTNKIEMLRIEDVVESLPTNIFRDVTPLKEILYKVIPVVKDATILHTIIDSLALDSEAKFMHLIVAFASERLVTATIGNLNTYTVVRSLMHRTPEMHHSLLNDEKMIKLVLRLSAEMNRKGLPLLDILNVVEKSMYFTQEPIITDSVVPRYGSWEREDVTSSMEKREGLRSGIKEIFERILLEL